MIVAEQILWNSEQILLALYYHTTKKISYHSMNSPVEPSFSSGGGVDLRECQLLAHRQACVDQDLFESQDVDQDLF